MDVNVITTLISSIGFPIVVAIAMFWYILRMNEQHKAEMEKITDAVNNNTLTMQKLIDKMESK